MGVQLEVVVVAVMVVVDAPPGSGILLGRTVEDDAAGVDDDDPCQQALEGAELVIVQVPAASIARPAREKLSGVPDPNLPALFNAAP